MTGTLHPFSDEMYLVSSDPDVPTGPLELEGKRTVIPLGNDRLVLVHEGDAVKVERERKN